MRSTKTETTSETNKNMRESNVPTEAKPLFRKHNTQRAHEKTFQGTNLEVRTTPEKGAGKMKHCPMPKRSICRLKKRLQQSEHEPIARQQSSGASGISLVICSSPQAVTRSRRLKLQCLTNVNR